MDYPNYIPTMTFVAFAKSKYEGQVDRAGKPYYEQIAPIRENVNKFLSSNGNYLLLPSEKQVWLFNRATIVAICHGLFKYTDTTKEDLIKLGADNYILDALDDITYDENMPYSEYIENMKCNGIAMIAKISDLAYNLNLTNIVGCGRLGTEILNYLNKYLFAYDVLRTNIDNWFKTFHSELTK